MFKIDINAFQRQDEKKRRAKTKESLLKVVADTEDRTVDRQTKGEITSLLNVGKIDEADKLRTQSLEGVDKKFIARQASDAQFDFMVDQPGAKQTRIDGFVNASMQLVGRR